MVTKCHLGVVQQIIHYIFRCSDLLKLALTAAGAEEAKPDGNRNLATVGRAALQLAVVNMGCDNLETRRTLILSLTKCSIMIVVPLDSSLENLVSGSVLAYLGHDIQIIFDDAASHASRTTPVECSGAPVSPLRTCQRRCESDENELIPDVGTETRARKPPKQQQNGTSEPDTGWLSLFLAEEEERCSGLGLPGPRVTFMNEDTVKNISDLAGKNGDIPAKIVIGISSASATIALQGAIKVLREKPSSHSHSSLNKIPTPERFAAIKIADQQISSLALLKRCHVIRLWEDHWAGNPRNIEKNKTIRELLSRICPDLDEGSSNYARMHEKAKALEKLGRRLYMLSCEYRIGILGLMLEFTDQMLLKPTDADFKQLLRVLDRSQGKEMRAFAEAATPVVNCVLEGTLRNADYFPFELVESSYIAGLPKNSPALLSLLAGYHLQHRSQEALDARRQ